MASLDSLNHISLLIGTRDRVNYLNNFMESVEETATNRRNIEVALYLDEDDSKSQDYIKSASQKFSFKVRTCIRQSPIALGEMQNILWQTSPHRDGIYITAVDDYIYTSKGWDDEIRDAFSQYNDRIALVYTEDPTVPDLATMPILSDQWIRTVGNVLTTYFPFWYSDVWSDEVAQMVQRRHRINMGVATQGGKGKTARMRNLVFWQRFFLLMVVERLAHADKLRAAIYNRSSEQFKESELLGRELALKFLNTHDHSDDELLASERELAAPTNWADPRKYYSYIASELKAVHKTAELLAYAVRMNDYEFVARALDVISKSSVIIPELDIFKSNVLKEVAVNYRTLPKFMMPR